MADPPTPAARAGDGAGSPRSRGFHGWWIVAALSVTQTVGYGVLFYAFAVFLTPMQRDLNASATQITGALTLALLVTAVAAVPVGRWLDRHGGRALMTAGSIAATLLVLAWSRVDNLVGLYLVFAGIGLASAMVLYESAFAVIVALFDRNRANALLAVTVVAGFASTIFMPLTGWLTEAYGWRTALLALAALYGVLTIPLHALIRDRRPRSALVKAGGVVDRQRVRVVRKALRDPAFWTLTTAFLAHSAAVTVIGVHLVAYLLQLGHPAAFAATITGLIGVLSVTGRLATTVAQRHRSPTTVVAAVFALQAAAALTLPAIGRNPAGAIVCVILLGLGFGVATIARPALLVELYGTTAYATISGLMALPLTLAKATAPLAAALLLTATGSYTPVMNSVAVGCAIAATGLMVAGRLRRRGYAGRIMTTQYRLLLICGSLRSGSTNAAVLQTAHVAAPRGVTTSIYAKLDALPHFNPDDDNEPLHPAVAELREQIQTADALLFCTPEYAGALPGSFKNLLDWTIGGGEIYGKPVAWINASSVAAPTGGAAAHDSLRAVLGYAGTEIVEAACTRIPMTRQAVDPADGLIHDPALREPIRNTLTAIAQHLRLNHGDQAPA